MTSTADISIIVVNFNSGQMLEECIESIKQHHNPLKVETIVIDNSSHDNSCFFLESRAEDDIILIKNSTNIGFPKACNQGIRRAQGNIILLLNPDARLQAGVLPVLLDGFKQYAWGIATVAQTNGEHTFSPCYQFPSLRISFQSMFLRMQQPHAKLTPITPPAEKYHWFEVQGYVSGAFLAITRAVIEHIGLMDEHLFWAEDSDWCKRALDNGIKIGYCDDILVFHHVSAIAKKHYDLALYFQYVSKHRYFRKHLGRAAELLYKLIVTLSIIPKWLFLRLLPSTLTRSFLPETRCRSYQAVLTEFWLGKPAPWEP